MPLPRSFLFVRHGETDWNREGRLQGHTDIPLNQNGLNQANFAAKKLVGKNIGLIVSSPLLRAHKTAEIIADHLQLPVHVDDGLKERSFGVFEGTVRDLLPDEFKHGDDPRATKVADGAESFDILYKRTFNALAAWLHNHPDEHILFVSHGAVFGAVHFGLFNRYGSTTNAVPVHFSKNGAAWVCDHL